MGKVTTTIRIDKKILKEAKALGANISVLTENTLKEFVQRNKPRKSSSGDCNGGTIEDNGVQERNLDNTNFSGSRRRRPGAWRPSGSTSVVNLP